MVKNKPTRYKARKHDAWFIPIRGSYLPASAVGWSTYVPFIAYLVFSGVVGIKETASVALAILFIVPNWVAATAVMTYIAARKS